VSLAGLGGGLGESKYLGSRVGEEGAGHGALVVHLGGAAAYLFLSDVGKAVMAFLDTVARTAGDEAVGGRLGQGLALPAGHGASADGGGEGSLKVLGVRHGMGFFFEKCAFLVCFRAFVGMSVCVDKLYLTHLCVGYMI
jgi:hypothetical protein